MSEAFADRYTKVADHIDWKPAIDLYYQDRLKEAYAIAAPLGTGLFGRYLRWYRMIEAEYVTRARSTTTPINDWLQVETISDEIETEPHQAILNACNQTAHRFGWQHGHPTLVSILAAEADAPWTTGRYGFCIDRQPYAKICLPHYLAQQPQQLHSAVAHEYAHVMTGASTHGRIPRWLDEAIAMVAGDEWDPRILQAIQRGQLPWLSPQDLENAYGSDRREPGGETGDIRLAYHQSGIIGRYLASLKGEQAFGVLMSAFSNNSLWTEAKIAAGLESPVDEALREVYGVKTDQLFRDANNWHASSRSIPPGAERTV